jgi:hypothetical protein
VAHAERTEWESGLRCSNAISLKTFTVHDKLYHQLIPTILNWIKEQLIPKKLLDGTAAGATGTLAPSASVRREGFTLTLDAGR